MTKPNINWRNAQLPEKTAVFAIGDIHGHDNLLKPMLAAIEDKIKDLPPDVQAKVIFIGDYIDRGPSGPRTIDMLLKFEKDMANKGNIAPDKPKVTTTFLCGNHDEYFKRLLEAPHITNHIIGDPNNRFDHRHCLSEADGSLTIMGLEANFFSGSGLTTLKDYWPDIDPTLFDEQKKCFNRSHPELDSEEKLIKKVNEIVKTYIEKIGKHLGHKEFFTRIYNNSHIRVSDYLFTHAGIDPEKSLADQGIDLDSTHYKGKEYLDYLMIRNPFLWRNDDNLPKCDPVVVHGHTPSVIKFGEGADTNIIADGQKNYRLCIDTGVYAKNGALTCFTRYGDKAAFMAVNQASPDKVAEYSIPEKGQWAARVQHIIKCPEYHNLANQAICR